MAMSRAAMAAMGWARAASSAHKGWGLRGISIIFRVGAAACCLLGGSGQSVGGAGRRWYGLGWLIGDKRRSGVRVAYFPGVLRPVPKSGTSRAW